MIIKVKIYSTSKNNHKSIKLQQHNTEPDLSKSDWNM